MMADTGGLPNILLVVWDACRPDYASEHAPNLNELAGSNVRFENAIAPAPWSLPSHASMLSGDHVPEHGSLRVGDSIHCGTVEMLSEMGYTCYGISANGFASQRTGFHEVFDEFYYTGGRDPYPEGIDVSGTAQEILRAGDKSHADALREVLRSIPGHDYRLKSLVNLLAVGCGEAALAVEALQRILHPWFAPDSGYCYDPERNTDRLADVLAEDDGPFFVFMNYMDTHRPYKPGPDRQRQHVGRTLSRRELRSLNESVAHPSRFLEGVETGRITDEQVETVRGLYAGEVETADAELGRVREHLERTGHREDTLVVVTSDHGENLGEVDEMGRTRMGHEASVSDAVLSVPLVMAHPDLDARTVGERVSLTDLHDLFLDAVTEFLDSGGAEPGKFVSDEPVVSYYPAVGGKELFEKYPDAPEEVLSYRISVDTVVGYRDGWKAVVSSNGERWARNGDEVADYENAPSVLRTRCEDELTKLTANADDADLSDEELAQLEALGYL